MSKNLGDMVVRIVGENAEFDSSIDKSESKFKKFGDTATSMGGKLSLFVTTPLILLGKKFIDSVGQMQMFQASFETMLGSVENAKSLMLDLQNFAAKTPFEFTGLANASKTLLQFGVNTKNVMPTLKQLGDIAQGDQNKLNSLALVFGQMSSAGKLMGQDLLQMINAGFNPLREISDATGESYTSLRQKMEKGLITTDMVTESFKRSTEAGGKFFNGMEKASKTLPGLMSTLNDDFMTMGRSLVDSLIPPLTQIVKHLSGFFKWVTDLSPVTQRWIVGLAALAAGIGPLILGVGGMVKAIGALKIAMQALAIGGGPIMIAIAAVAALAAGFVYLAQKTEENKKKQREFWDVGSQSQEQLQTTIDISSEKYLKLTDRIEKTNDALKETKQSIEDTAAAMKKQGYTEEQVANFRKSALEGISDDTTELVAEQKKYGDHVKKATAQLIALRNASKQQADDLTVEEEAKKRLAAAQEKYNTAMGIANQLVNESKSENQILNDQIKQLEGIKGKTEAEEIDRKQAIAILIDKQIANIEKDADAYVKAAQEKKKVEKELYDETTGKRENAYKEMAELYKTDTQKKLDSIDTQAVAWIQAGMDEVTATEWAESEKTKVTDEAEKVRKALAISNTFNAINSYMDIIKSVSDAMMVSVEDGWADLSTSVLDSVGSMASSAGDTLTAGITGVTSTIIDVIDSWIDYEKNVAQTQFENINDINTRIRDYKIEMIKDELDATLDALDKEEQAALEAAGLADKTEMETLQEKLAAETDEADKAEIQKSIDKQAIEDEYARKKAEAEEAAAKETRRLEREKAEFEKELTLAKIKIERQEAISNLGWGHATEKKELNSMYDELEAVVASMPLPSLASGAIAMPKNGGTNVTVAEAGMAEAIIPLNRLGEVLSDVQQASPITTIDNDIPIHLQVLMDSRVFLDKIFPATKNKTILIHANAVVQ